MKRRDFIQVLGAGSSIVLVPSLLNGCATLRATESWKGPAPGEQDIRRLALSYAILAPNPHNKQPWLIDLTGELSFNLYVDRARLLPQTDPPARQIHIGQGTFLENLELAARQLGHRADITYFPSGMYGNDVVEDKPVASIELVPDDAVSKDPLFEQILARQTNKRAFDGEPLPAADIVALGKALEGGDYPLTLTTDRRAREQLPQLLIDAMKVEVADTTRHAETVEMFRFDDEEMERHRDGFGLAQSGVTGFSKWFAESFILSRDSAVAADSSFGTGTIDLTSDQARTASAFGWMTSQSNTRLDQVKVGRMYSRLCLAATALGIAHHPMSQLLQEYFDMTTLQRQLLDLLDIPDGHTVQMLFRLGRADAVARSPRRRIEALITA